MHIKYAHVHMGYRKVLSSLGEVYKQGTDSGLLESFKIQIKIFSQIMAL